MSAMGLLPASARARRRLAWVGAVVLAVAGLTSLVVMLPKGARSHTTTSSSGNARVVTTTRREVPLAAADRKAITATLDAFVKTAVARRNVAASYELATPELRGGRTRAEWATGNIPVFPYVARGRHFGGWRLKYSYHDDAGLDVLLHPRAGSKLGPVSFAVELKRLHGRWLVDSFVPTAVFSPPGSRPNITAAPDFGPQLAGGSGEGRFSRLWLIVPAALLGLAFLIPIALALVGRRRRYRPTRGELPPLPTRRANEPFAGHGAEARDPSRGDFARVGSRRLE